MNQERLLFEYSSGFIILCVLVGIGYAYLLYRGKHPWNKTTGQVLFFLRAGLVSLLAFLLIGPILKLTKNIFEDPVLVVLVDDSASMKEGVKDTELSKAVVATLNLEPILTEGGYEMIYKSMSDGELVNNQFNLDESDLDGRLRKIVEEQEGRNLNGIVLLSDGIYNSGASPPYSNFSIPIFTVGLGDTIQRVDAVLKNIYYNKIISKRKSIHVI